MKFVRGLIVVFIGVPIMFAVLAMLMFLPGLVQAGFMAGGWLGYGVAALAIAAMFFIARKVWRWYATKDEVPI